VPQSLSTERSANFIEPVEIGKTREIGLLATFALEELQTAE
jgi:hypothetical protein